MAAGPLPSTLTASFTAADTANLTAAGTDYDTIAEPTKTKLREAVLAQNYASFNLPYQANPPGFLIFEDLIWVTLSNIRVDFEPRNTRIFTGLDCRSNGSIDGTLAIPYLAVFADIQRSPSATYNAIAAVSDPAIGPPGLTGPQGATQHYVPVTFNARRGYIYAHQDFRSLVNLVLEGNVDPNTLDCAAGAALRPKK